MLLYMILKNITVLLYFWSNKNRLAENKRLLKIPTVWCCINHRLLESLKKKIIIIMKENMQGKGKQLKISICSEHIVVWKCRKLSSKHKCQVRIPFRNFETEICWMRITNSNQGQLSNTLICSWSSQKLEIDPAVCDKIQRTSGALI